MVVATTVIEAVVSWGGRRAAKMTPYPAVCMMVERYSGDSAPHGTAQKHMITFTYELTGSGWARAMISDGASEATIEDVSYMTDALGDLVRSVVALLEGAKRAEFSWTSERRDYDWLLTSRDGKLFLRVTQYRDWVGQREATDRGKPVLKLRCDLRAFTAAVLAELAALYTTLGLKGYKHRWVQHEFPYAEYRRLEALLAASSRSGDVR